MALKDAHPLIGCSGVFYSPEGSEFIDHRQSPEDKAWCKEVVIAKFGPSGILALQKYLEGIGYWLPKPEMFSQTICDKPILFWNFPGTAWKRIGSKELADVLTPHALTIDQCATTEDLIFGVIHWKLQ